MSTKKINPPLEPILTRLEKFWLYETNTMYYLVGFDILETEFRMLKINRTKYLAKNLSEIVNEDPLSYSKNEIGDILEMISEGNKVSGGLTKVCTAYGLVGFVKFLDCYYFTMITQRKEVGSIGGNFIYTIKATEMFSVKQPDIAIKNVFTKIWNKVNRKINQTSAEIAEARYMGLFQFVDMTKDFFFSYSYDLTHSLQRNYITSINRANLNYAEITKSQETFEWNYFQTEALKEITLSEDGSLSPWILPITHGSYQQKRFSLFGKIVDMSLLARRSRHYAGTRYLKRGISVHGKVANDCEIEQIIQHEIRNETSFCSYVQVRGSIPTYWFQETSVTMPKPPILINRVDPDYLATTEHFVDLMQRYSAPIIVLDLVKHHEKRARESLVGKEFQQAVSVMNDSIPAAHKILYIALDYSKITSISKGKHGEGKGKGTNAAATGGGAMGVAGSEWANMANSLGESELRGNDEPPFSHNPAGKLLHAGEAESSTGNGGVAGGGDAMSGTGGGAASGGPGAVGSPAGSIDVLRELENIAKLTIHETGFFCNTLTYIEAVKLVSPQKMAQAHIRCDALSDAGVAGGRGGSTDYLEQRGVLRTNCIDCLDRTNGGQFAVAMKFLSVSLEALGLSVSSNGTGNIDAGSPMLHALMDMFGEMGDRIALQYGGSEAHKKVITGKGAPANAASAKSSQGELLTSMKRYYSNAFTDVVKQDAMNVFLGCYEPSKETNPSLPLWDLDSDYHLHNKELRPAEPLANKIMFGDIVNENKKLLNPMVKLLTENAVKKVFSDAHEHVDIFGFPIGLSPSSSSFSSAVVEALQQRGGDGEDVSTVLPIRQKSMSHQQPVVATGGMTVQMPRSNGTHPSTLIQPPRTSSLSASVGGEVNFLANIETYIKSLPHVPKIDMETILSRYFIRSIGKAGFAGANTTSATGADSGGGTAAAAPLSLQSVDGSNVTAASFRSKGAMAHAIRFIARCEKRKLIRKITCKKISRATEAWWRNALWMHERQLYGNVRITARNIAVAPAAVTTSTLRAASPISGPTRESPATVQQEQQLQHQQSYFDRVYTPHVMTEFDSLLSMDFFAPIDASHYNIHVTKLNSNPAASAAASSAPTAASSTAAISGSFSETAAAAGGRVPGSQFQSNSPPTVLGDVDYTAGGDEDDDPAAGAAGGWFVAKYVREMGQKARTLVGGLMLRKEGNAVNAISSPKTLKMGSDVSQDWHSKYQQITGTKHSVTRESSVLYNRYVQVAENHLLLLNDRNNPRYIKALSEEYRVLLREYCVDMDHVAEMEHLATESHIASIVSGGIYQGMKQTDSAIMAQAFLYENFIFIEEGLQHYGLYRDAIEQDESFNTRDAFHSAMIGSSGQLHIAFPTSAAAAGTMAPSSPIPAMQRIASKRSATASHATTALTASLRRGPSSHTIGPGSLVSAAQQQQQQSLRPQGTQEQHQMLQHQHQLMQQQKLKTSLTLETATLDRMRYLQLRGRAQWPSAVGLEAEFRKNVSNYVFQKYAYAKEISPNRLARRMSTLTSERTIVRYMHLFEKDQMASAVDEILFTACDSSEYQSFSELQTICDNLLPLLTRIKERKLEELQQDDDVLSQQQQQQVRQTSSQDEVATANSCGGGCPAVDVGDNLTIGDVNDNDDDDNDNMYNMHFQYDIHHNRHRHASSSSPGASASDPKADTGIRFSSMPPVGGASSFRSRDAYDYDDAYYACAIDDNLMQNDFHTLYHSSPPAGVGGDDVDSSSGYAGFSLVSPDIYSRITNPHLLINEIGVIRFNQMLHIT